MDSAGWTRGRSNASSDAVAGAARQSESLSDLRDVFHVWLWALLLLHVAADLSHSRARVLDDQRKLVRRAAVSLRRRGEPVRRLAHGRAGTPLWFARCAVRARFRVVLHGRGADLRVNAGRRGDRESRTARAGA